MLEMLKPGIYTGDLRHRRLGPRPHEFTYRVFLALLDIDRIPELMRVSPFASYNRWNWATFAERDHFGDPRLPLRERLARDAAANGLQLPDGPVFLLTHLRYLGYCFNPISFFYCYTASGELEMVLAEVANTFGERHNYWLSAACRIPPVMNATPPADPPAPSPATPPSQTPPSAAPPSEPRPLESGLPTTRHPLSITPTTRRYRVPKQLHVSPFMNMSLDYAFALTPPGDRLTAHMDTLAAGQRTFDATLTLRREPWSAASLHRALRAHPWMTLKVIAAIHWQALRLLLKGVPVFTHPNRREKSA